MTFYAPPAAPPAPPAPPRAVRPPYAVRPFAITFTVLISVWFLLEICYMVALLIAGSQLLAASNGEYPQDYGLVFMIFLAASMRSLLIPPTALTAVAFLAWCTHARLNAERGAPGYRQRHSLGWVALSWFVPVQSFWRPKHVVDDIWLATEALAGRRASRPPRLSTLWWSCWWVALAAQTIVLAAQFANDGSTLYFALLRCGQGVAELPLIISGALVLAIVWRITGRQHPVIAPGPPRW